MFLSNFWNLNQESGFQRLNPDFLLFLAENPSPEIISGVAKMVSGVPVFISGVHENVSRIAKMILGIADFISANAEINLVIAGFSSVIA